MKRLLLLAVLAAAACGRKQAENYKHCLKLRVGMTREQMIAVMGEPEETIPFVEGKSLDYLRGRTAFEWSNPASMPGPDHVSLNDATGKIESIRCSNADITASVFVEPPAPSTAAAAAPAVAVSSAPAAKAGTAADALALYKAKDLQKALRIAVPLADGGDADAQYLTGLILFTADQVGLRADQNAAARQFYLAGRQKNCEAAALYASTLGDRGSGTATVEETAYAASLGCPAGKLLRGKLLLTGFKDLLEADPAQGETLLRESAGAGCPAAAAALGEHIAAGGKDPVEAYRWTLVAARHALVGPFDDPLHPLSNGWTADERAKAEAALAALKKTLKPAQAAEAEKRAGVR